MAQSLTLAVGVLALLIFALCGVVIELFRDVRQLREINGILDRPLEVDLEDVAGTFPSAHGLPTGLDAAAAAIILVLSDRCATCHALAGGFNGVLSPGLWVVLEARSPRSAEEFLARYELTSTSTGGRLIVDVAGRIAESIGLRTTPVGFRVREGRIVSATTIPSLRYLTSILPNRVRLERSPATRMKERVRV